MEDEIKARLDDLGRRLAYTEKRNEEITTPRFDEVDKRIATSDKRIDDVKWYVGGVTGVFTLVFSVIAVIANVNLNSQKEEAARFFNSQKEDLARFETNVKEDLGKFSEPPQIELLGVNGQPLTGQVVQATSGPDSHGILNLWIAFVVRNSGVSSSGTMFLKFYSSSIELADQTSDELRDKYKYEDFSKSDDLSPNNIPGKFSSVWHVNLVIKGTAPVLGEKYPGLVRIFYGIGKWQDAPVTLVFR
jgi:hypothetical protein